MQGKRIDREELKPGDHIYSWREAHIYAHHGIYVGEGMVINFTTGGQESGPGTFWDRFFRGSSSTRSAANPCPKCGGQSRLRGVISSCLDCFLMGGDLYRFEYGVSAAFFMAARPGTCTLASSDPPEDVLHRARYLLQNGFGVYNVFKNNCEDFAIYCKTCLVVSKNIGVGRSGQASSYLLAATFAAGGIFGYGMYCVSRLASDIGVRRDVVKVPVESLASHQG
ncbi:uncharacterized protein LOC114753726 [Neltuma alba]|uniref:uncharacterized protein LOC114753556 n=1 Tax=Neltuma alba TaxID=207710 RepID=UPI0010A2B583|nr:uncharacterized protein LOC114753556 [Prosopis alba]XP_028798270.1 uncharacterized protein LOC114753726 [Prosopis alba]